MKDVPVPTDRGEWTYQFENQWLALFNTDYNWATFTFFELEIEDERCLGRYNATIGFLGFSLYVSYVYDESPIKELLENTEEFLEDIREKDK